MLSIMQDLTILFQLPKDQIEKKLKKKKFELLNVKKTIHIIIK